METRLCSVLYTLPALGRKKAKGLEAFVLKHVVPRKFQFPWQPSPCRKVNKHCHLLATFWVAGSKLFRSASLYKCPIMNIPNATPGSGEREGVGGGGGRRVPPQLSGICPGFLFVGAMTLCRCHWIGKHSLTSDWRISCEISATVRRPGVNTEGEASAQFYRNIWSETQGKAV